MGERKGERKSERGRETEIDSGLVRNGKNEGKG